MWLVLVMLAIAVVIVIVLGPRVRRVLVRNPDDSTVGGYGYLIMPAVTLSSLLLSFTLVAVWSSYQSAVQRASTEALEVDHVADSAEMLPAGAEARAIAADIACYARAIAGPEWQAMNAGETTAPEVEVWTDRLERDIATLAQSTSGQSALTREILTADRARADARSARLAEARVSIPWLVMLLLTVLVALAVVGMGFAFMPGTGRALQIGSLIVVAGLFAALLATIMELDSPFHGLIDVEPIDMTRVAETEAVGFSTHFHGASLPCDEQGRESAP